MFYVDSLFRSSLPQCRLAVGPSYTWPFPVSATYKKQRLPKLSKTPGFPCTSLVIQSAYISWRSMVRFWWHGLVANDTRQECKYERSILANAYVMKNKKTWPNHRLICTVLLSFFLFCADLQTVKYSNTKSWYQTKRMKPQAEQCCFFYLTDREEFWLFVANFSAELLVQYTFNSFLGGVLSCKYPEIYEHFWIPFAMLSTVIKLKIEILEVLNMNALDWHNHI